MGTKGHPLTLSGAQKLPRTEAPPHGVGLPSTSLAIDIDAPIVACQAAGADLSSPKVGIDVRFFWFESHLTLQLSHDFFGVNMPSSRTHSKMHRIAPWQNHTEVSRLPGKIKVKMMESHSPKLLVTLFPRHQNKKQRILDFTISILSSGEKKCAPAVFLYSFPQCTKIMFPELLFSRFPNRTTHTFKDLLEGVDGRKSWKWPLEMDRLVDGGLQRKHCLFFQTLKRGIGVQIEYHLTSKCYKSILSPNSSKATQFKSLYYI